MWPMPLRWRVEALQTMILWEGILTVKANDREWILTAKSFHQNSLDQPGRPCRVHIDKCIMVSTVYNKLKSLSYLNWCVYP